MNNKLYGNLIFELSKPGRRAYSLPQDRFGHYDVPEDERRAEDAVLPECDEMTVTRHYTNHSGNNFGVDNGFYPLGSCTMKYNPPINEEIAAMPAFSTLHPLQPDASAQGAMEAEWELRHALSAITGMADFTLNPCAGAHGELRAHRDRVAQARGTLDRRGADAQVALAAVQLRRLAGDVAQAR